jgi:hypothetical protein
MTPMQVRIPIMAVAAMAALVGGCSSDSDATITAADAGSAKATIDVTVSDPVGTKAKSATQKLYLFDGACPADADLANGKVDGAIMGQNISQFDVPFTMSELDKKPIAFVAIFRTADCTVVSFGCTPADLTKHVHITVEVAEVVPPLGACASGTTCTDGACK